MWSYIWGNHCIYSIVLWSRISIFSVCLGRPNLRGLAALAHFLRTNFFRGLRDSTYLVGSDCAIARKVRTFLVGKVYGPAGSVPAYMLIMDECERNRLYSAPRFLVFMGIDILQVGPACGANRIDEYHSRVLSPAACSGDRTVIQGRWSSLTEGASDSRDKYTRSSSCSTHHQQESRNRGTTHLPIINAGTEQTREHVPGHG